MYVPPKLVKFEFLFDLFHQALQGHDKDYQVIFAHTCVPEGTPPNEVYKQYGPCGPYPYYAFWFFYNGENIPSALPNMTISEESLNKLRQTVPVEEFKSDSLSGWSFTFNPGKYQKSAQYDLTTPDLIPEICHDKGKYMIRPDRY